ncbi:hypothetical protein [Yeosuana marina]|uniref:hypothetical protein n=1 Tax=Yeosuana marina TaxID=1565536 RepID=UPI001422E5C4|nr:hypothetical protein [Yeosuana marina]
MEKAIIVKTKTGKKGYIFYKENNDLKAEKLQVKIIDNQFKETGEKLLCTPSSLTAIGYKD